MPIDICRYLQLDVFAQRAGCGNPLGVVLGAEDWPDRRMQGFAAWTNLVETTFVLTPTAPDASYRLRIFTPNKEIAFAGPPRTEERRVGKGCVSKGRSQRSAYT